MFNRRPQHEDEGTFISDVLKVAIGVFIGGLLAALAYERLLDWRMERAARQMAAELREKDQRDSAAAERRLQQQRLNLAAQQQESQRIRDAQALAQRLERERQERKTKAWEAYFKPSPACQLDPLTLPCANAHMAARKRFESAYVDR